MIRVLHSADWQIGRLYGSFDPDDAVPLAEARFAAGPASRFGNLTAGLLSFELDCQAADFRENPGSASCCQRIEREISISMTGIKVQPSYSDDRSNMPILQSSRFWSRGPDRHPMEAVRQQLDQPT